MEPFPKLKPLSVALGSDLAVIEVLVHYDRPLCVLLRDMLNRYYLAHFIIGSKDQEHWLLTPISMAVLHRLVDGRIPLIDGLSEAANEMRLLVRGRPREDGFHIDQAYACPPLDGLKRYLPNSNYVFAPDEFQDLQLVELEPIQEYANRTKGEVIYLRLRSKFGLTPWTTPMAKLAQLAVSLQRLLTNLVLSEVSGPALKGRGHGNLAVEKGSEFAITGLLASSLILRLESVASVAPVLIQETDYAYRAAKQLLDLLQEEDPEKLCKQLEQQRPRVTSSFRNYIEILNGIKAGTEIRWASRHGEKSDASWSTDNVQELAIRVAELKIASEDTLTLEGFFVEGSMESRKFTFIEAISDRRIEGRFSDQISQQTVQLCAKGSRTSMYRVSVLEKVSVTSTNTTQYEYQFVEVDPLS